MTTQTKFLDRRASKGDLEVKRVEGHWVSMADDQFCCSVLFCLCDKTSSWAVSFYARLRRVGSGGGSHP